MRFLCLDCCRETCTLMKITWLKLSYQLRFQQDEVINQPFRYVRNTEEMNLLSSTFCTCNVRDFEHVI